MTATGPHRDLTDAERAGACRLCHAEAGTRCVVVAGRRAGEPTAVYEHWVRVEDLRGASRRWAAEQALTMAHGGLASAEVKANGGPYRGRHLAGARS